MFTFTGQHILVMRLIAQHEIESPALLHNFLFLASAESLDYHDLGFYDFVRTRNGAYSPAVQSILEDLITGQLLTKEPLRLSTKGMDTYYALASSLRPFEDFINRCFSIYMRNKDNIGTINEMIKTNLLFRKVKQGKKIFPNPPEA